MNSIEENIIELITSFLAGEISPDELKILQQWIQSSNENRRYFEEMKAVWQATGSMDASATFNVEKAKGQLYGKKAIDTYHNHGKASMNLVTSKTKHVIRRMLQIAAMVVFIFLAGSVTTYYTFKSKIEKNALAGTPSLSKQPYKLIVPWGAKSTFLLPDGTKVFINAGSSLTYTADYGVISREVTLEGEAYFDVKTNPEKPFTIHTSDLDIRAFGTAFNVKAYPEDPMIVTTLEHGELKLESRNNDGFDMVLQPKQNVVYYKTEAQVQTKQEASKVTSTTAVQPEVKAPTVTDNVNTNLYTSWKDPEWIVDSQTLGDLAISLERRYNVRIVFASNDLKANYRFSGTIRKETIEQVLTALTYTAPMKYTIDQGVVQLQIDQKRKHNYDALSK